MIGLSALIAGGMVLLTGAGKGAPVKSSLPVAGPNADGALIDQGPSDADFVNSTLNLLDSTLIELDLDTTPGLALEVAIPLDGVDYTLHLAPRSNRSVDYTLRVQTDDGFMNALPGPERTLSGTLVEETGASVAASMMEDGLYASIIMPDGETWWLEPVADILGEQGMHAVYHNDDIIPSGGSCGADAEFMANHVGFDTVDEGTILEVGQQFNCAELAADADFQYFLARGSSVAAVEARIELVIGLVNNQYQTQVNISHVITNITVRASLAENPYSTNDAGDLLGQLRSEWQANGGAIPRDVVHLFTGRNLNGGTIGVAFLGAICNFNLEYGLVQSDCCGSTGCSTDLSAHELGHNWGAGHCSCPGNTMNPSITCTNNFSAGTISSISSYRNSILFCLDQCGGVLGPENDDCSDALPVGNGTTQYDTTDASTDGDANQCGGDDIVNDIWYDYTATCNGTVTVSLCFSGFDTQLEVYDGANCGSAPLLACANDGCGAGALQSELSFPAVLGSHYLIRIGGVPGPFEEGAGPMTISCVEFATGACCIDETCFSLSSANCSASGGTYFGDGTPCSPDPCAPPVGACCLGASCVSVTAADCAQFAGSYQGDDSTCVPNPCSEPTGACCLSDGSCVTDTASGCASAGGTYQGDGSDCGAANCTTFCPADITGPNGAGNPDGNVDSLDFLLLIGQWGSPCVGSCEADITGPTPLVPDGNIDSLDILLMISQWGSPGNCP